MDSHHRKLEYMVVYAQVCKNAKSVKNLIDKRVFLCYYSEHTPKNGVRFQPFGSGHKTSFKKLEKRC